MRARIHSSSIDSDFPYKLTIRKCRFHENLGFSIEFDLQFDKNNEDNLKDKIEQLFDIDAYICTVRCSKISNQLKTKWNIDGSERSILMSLGRIDKLKKILLEMHMHKSTLRNIQSKSFVGCLIKF